MLKAAKEKQQYTYKGEQVRIITNFSKQTLNARRAWRNIFQALKENNCQPNLIYLVKLTFVIEGKKKTFHANKN
jgi:EAL domain-containing protein (putative c-di-GMP-specific phosphodiesterase class I)